MISCLTNKLPEDRSDPSNINFFILKLLEKTGGNEKIQILTRERSKQTQQRQQRHRIRRPHTNGDILPKMEGPCPGTDAQSI
jgi:hypothetical protein